MVRRTATRGLARRARRLTEFCQLSEDANGDDDTVTAAQVSILKQRFYDVDRDRWLAGGLRVLPPDGMSDDLPDCVLPATAGSYQVRELVKTIAVASPALARWSVPLLQSRHVDAAERLATFLGRRRATLPEVADELLPVALDRMEDAAGADGTNNLSRALVALVIGVDQARSLQAEDVRRVHQIIRSHLRPRDPGAGRTTTAQRRSETSPDSPAS